MSRFIWNLVRCLDLHSLVSKLINILKIGSKELAKIVRMAPGLFRHGEEFEGGLGDKCRNLLSTCFELVSQDEAWQNQRMIYIDADGCPVKDEIYKVAERFQVEVILVANKSMNIPQNALFRIEVVSSAFDAADDWIAEHATKRDVVVTADILLAERCVKNGCRVLGHKGIEFNEDNIGMSVAHRELLQNLRHMGETRGGPAPMDKKARSQFLSTLDQILHALKKTPL